MESADYARGDIFFLSYVVGMLVGQIPLLSGNIVMIVTGLKVLVSLPVFFLIFFIYIANSHRVHERPIFWSCAVFLGVLFLFTCLYLFLFWGALGEGVGIILPTLIVLVPSLAVSCACFAFLIRRVQKLAR